jgi:hypothetical protein
MKRIFQAMIALLLSTSVLAQISGGSRVYDELNEKYTSGLFKTADGTIVDVMNEPAAAAYFNVLNFLQGRVAGLQIYTTRTGTAIPYIRGSRARIFIDEMQIDPGFLNSLPVADIAIIKVIKGPFAGSFGNGSAIAIYRIQPEEADED